MNDHSATCSLAIVNSPNIRCNVVKNRKEMLSQVETIDSCDNKFYGCDIYMTRMDLKKHHETCQFCSCVVCNEYLKQEELSTHICDLETIESPYLNKEESLRMSDKRHHKYLKCKFCKYIDVCLSEVLLHMAHKCKRKQRKCLLCCKTILSAEWEEHRLSNCNATVRCTECKLRIEKSSETEHQKECIGNIERTTCLICKELINTGHIKCRQDMDRHHEMHKDKKSSEADSKKPRQHGESDWSIDPKRVLANATEIDREKVMKIRQPEQPSHRESLQRFRKYFKSIILKIFN